MQGRVFAASPDEAAMKIRDKWGEGSLTILHCEPVLKWYEYVIEIGCGYEGKRGKCNAKRTALKRETPEAIAK
jgi:hypothetical protein